MDHASPIMHLTTGLHVVSYTLCYVLLNFIKMSDGHSLIAEAHQSNISLPMHLIISNTPEAEQLISMMNKNLSAFLVYVLKEQGFPKELIDDLLKNSCKATMLAKMHQCKWDPVNQVLITEEEESQVAKTKAFKGATWFKDEFGLLAQNSCAQKRYTASEALVNLDESGLRKTIHEPHEEHHNKNSPNASAGTPPRTAQGKIQSAVCMVDLTGSTRDSASQMSSSSFKDDLSLSNKRSCSKVSSNSKDGTSAAGSG
jgi:hypothetical protein